MKIEEINGKTDSELAYDLASLKKELFSLRIAMASETSAETAKIGKLRRAIARVKTVLHERARNIHGRGPR